MTEEESQSPKEASVKDGAFYTNQKSSDKLARQIKEIKLQRQVKAHHMTPILAACGSLILVTIGLYFYCCHPHARAGVPTARCRSRMNSRKDLSDNETVEDVERPSENSGKILVNIEPPSINSACKKMPAVSPRIAALRPACFNLSKSSIEADDSTPYADATTVLEN